jgi:hypothetical protein
VEHSDFAQNINAVAGNGKLTTEMFAAAGVAVGVRPVPVGAGEFSANVRSKSFFEGAIAAAWQKTTQGIFDTGRALLAAQEELDRDVFKALRLPFGKRTKERLMSIAGNLVLATHVSQLPPHWGTLYELDQIPDPELRALFANGSIHPGLERKAVRGLLGWQPRSSGRTRKGGGQEETPLDPVAVWQAFSPADKRSVLDSEGRTGLAMLVSSDLLADLVNHEVAQQLASGPNPKLKAYPQATLTKIFWKIIGAAKIDDTAAVSQACAGLLRKCEAYKLDYRDLQLASPKKHAPKKR